MQANFYPWKFFWIFLMGQMDGVERGGILYKNKFPCNQNSDNFLMFNVWIKWLFYNSLRKNYVHRGRLKLLKFSLQKFKINGHLSIKIIRTVMTLQNVIRL